MSPSTFKGWDVNLILNFRMKQGGYMAQTQELDELIVYGIRELSTREKEEVLKARMSPISVSSQ